MWAPCIMPIRLAQVTPTGSVGLSRRPPRPLLFGEWVTDFPVVDDRMVLLGVVGVRSAVRGYLRMASAPTLAVERPKPVAATRKTSSSLG